MNFISDTASPAHPAILAALTQANAGPMPSYGADSFVQAATDRLREVFETDLEVWFVSSGTAANALALSVLCPSSSAIICHAEAHIERDERGAPEFFTGGARLSLMPGEHGKIDVAALRKRVDESRAASVHETPAHVLSLSNLTECGTAYTPDEIAERAAAARSGGLKVHLDGARFANALLATASTPAQMSWRAGVDVLSFGATKNGALGCEAILLFGEAQQLIGDLKVRAKRAGHMPPKMRFIGAQMAAYLEGGLWLDLAGRANTSAKQLAAVLVAAGGKLIHPADGNEIFLDLSDAAAARLTAAGATFYPWPGGGYRFVCSWATAPHEIRAAQSALSPT